METARSGAGAAARQWCGECDGEGAVGLGEERRTCPVCGGDGETDESRKLHAALDAAGKSMKGVQVRLEQLNRELRGQVRLDEIRRLARLLVSDAEEVLLDVDPVCHNCDRKIPFGAKCCGGCWHAHREDGRCELATEEPIDVEGEEIATEAAQ